jgi:uncharacterized protein YfaS (alpha-2-macroglobulin family)
VIFAGSSAAVRFRKACTQINDVRFYANALPRGTYIVTYEARASVAGEFQVMPTHAFAAVMPDIFGRSAGQRLTVTATE